MRISNDGILPTPPPSNGRVWSPQQLAFLEAVRTNGPSIRVDAVAGAGKTTILVEGCAKMSGKVAFLAFNKKIADDIKKRVGHLTHVKAGTFHSFGLAGWKSLHPSCAVDGEKIDKIMEDERIDYQLTSFVAFVIGIAKQSGRGVIPDAPSWEEIADYFDMWDKVPDRMRDEALRACDTVWSESVRLNPEVIDFNDMLHAPLTEQCIRAEFDWVLVDEAQDTNPVRRLFARRLLKPGGRLVAVGDPHQAIYGFTGADNRALDLVEQEFSCVRMPLTITYRCPQAVVRHARQWVSHIEAAPTAPEGIVRSVTNLEFEKQLWSTLGPTDAILCRLTRPIISLALQLVRQGIGCRVEGRDIGAGLVRLATRWRSINKMDDLVERLHEYQAVECEKLRRKNRRAQIASLEDRVASLVAIIDHVGAEASMAQLRLRIETLFADTDPGAKPTVVTLSTVHKAKGREWDRVFLLGRDQFMPSEWATQAWEREQEVNLIYVAVTRAKRELVEVMLGELAGAEY